MLSESEYRQLVELARLDASDKVLQQARLEFNNILEYINKIEEIKIIAKGKIIRKKLLRIDRIEQLKADTQPKSIQNHFRDNSDSPPVTMPISTELNEQDIASFAPQWEAKHFVVPGVIVSEE